MTKDTLLMLVGGLIALLPFLGFPNAWDTVILVFLGACVIALGIAVRRTPSRTPASSTHETPRAL